MMHLVSGREFLVAFAVGITISAVHFLGRDRRVIARPLIVAAIASLAGSTRPLVWSWPIATGIIVTAAGVAVVWPIHRRMSTLGCIPGALLVGFALPERIPSWITWTTIGAVIAGTVAIGATDRAHTRVTIALLVLSAGGLYVAVPDTEHAAALCGGTLAAASLVVARRSGPCLPAAAALAGTFAWATAIGGFARPPTVVAAYGCVGMIAIVPSLGQRGRILLSSTLGVAVTSTLHLAVVAISARVASQRASIRSAILVEVVTYSLAILIALGIGDHLQRGRVARAE